MQCPEKYAIIKIETSLSERGIFMLKRTISILLCAILLIFAAGCGKEPVSDRSTLDFVRDMGLGINLGNALDSTGTWFEKTVEAQETAWGSPIITEDAIKGYAAAGFGVMRLPVSWTVLMDENGKIDPDFMDRVEEIVGWILDSGMKCILNTHHDGWSGKVAADRDGGLELYKNMWTQIADRFKNYGEDLMFESMNEEGFDSLWNRYGGTSGKSEAYALFNELNKTFVDVIRSSGGNNPERHLLLASYWTDINCACDDEFILPDDPAGKITISVHYYDPSTLTIISEDVDWGKAQTEWGSEDDLNYLNGQMDKLVDKFVSNGIPVIVGEYGCFGENKSREVIELWTESVAEAAYSRGICPILWDTSGDEYDRSACKFRRPEFIEELISIAK